MHLNFLGNFTIKPIIKLETLYSFIYHYYFLYKVYFYYISTLIRHIYFKTTKLRSPRPQIEICIHFYLLKHNVLYVFCQHLWALYERTPCNSISHSTAGRAFFTFEHIYVQNYLSWVFSVTVSSKSSLHWNDEYLQTAPVTKWSKRWSFFSSQQDLKIGEWPPTQSWNLVRFLEYEYSSGWQRWS